MNCFPFVTRRTILQPTVGGDFVCTRGAISKKKKCRVGRGFVAYVRFGLRFYTLSANERRNIVKRNAVTE